MSGRARPRTLGDRGVSLGDRGQLVLLAGVVVALALIAMLTAYLQLGYQAEVEPSVDRPASDGTDYLRRATVDAVREVRGEYAWAERRDAVTEIRDRLRPRLRRLAAARVEEGIVYDATYNRSVTRRWTGPDCPSGPDREFGGCLGDRGVVVQERAGRTHVLAVGFDLNVTAPDRRTSLTVVVNTTG